MKHIKRFFWAYLLVLAGLWWFTDQTVWAELPNFFAWRSVLMQGTGVLAIAVRPVVFEPWRGGLDKMYRLHKWLGISGLVLSIGHWLLSESAKWLVGLGWLARPERGPRPTLVDEPVRQFFMDQRGLAEGLGEWAFYAAVALMVLALIKRFPYRYFFRTHNLLAVAF